jgi:hypothetical protein
MKFKSRRLKPINEYNAEVVFTASESYIYHFKGIEKRDNKNTTPVDSL